MPSGGRSQGLSKEQALYLAMLEREGDYESLVANVAEIERTRSMYSVAELLAAYQNRDMRAQQYALTEVDEDDSE